MNENIYHIKSSANYSNKLYAIMNTKTMKLETTLTNPGHKFWEVRGHCINALTNYKKKYERYNGYNGPCKMINPNDLKIVEFSLLLNGTID